MPTSLRLHLRLLLTGLVALVCLPAPLSASPGDEAARKAGRVEFGGGARTVVRSALAFEGVARTMSVAERDALFGEQVQMRARVRELHSRMTSLPHGAGRSALASAIAQIKRDMDERLQRVHSGADALPATGTRAGGGPNLTPTMTPANWSWPAVPRNADDAGSSVFITPTLDGNAPTTYFNWATFQDSPGTLPSWASDIWVDEDDFSARFTAPDPASPGFHGDNNRGPYTVRGGRHSLSVTADPGGAISETDEGDNVWTGQWVWSPLDVPRHTAVERTAPPERGVMPLPNSDGLMCDRYPLYAWGVAIAPLGTDDYDLYAYEDYGGSTSGFSWLRSQSLAGPGETDFVVAHFWQTPDTLFPAVVRSSVSGGANYIIEHDDADGRSDGTSASFTGETLAPGQIIDVYEMELVVGQTVFLSLLKRSGDDDVAFEVFTGLAGNVHARGAGATSSAHDDNVQVLVYTATASGYHPIVVYRTTGANAASAVTYDFQWQEGTFVDVQAPAPPPALAFAAPSPNPMHGETRLRFSLPEASGVTLAIYDVTGRRVRTVVEGRFEPGVHALSWRGRDDAGRPVEPGLYWAHMRALGTTFVRRVAVLR